MIKKTLLLTCVLLSTLTAGAQKEVLSFEGRNPKLIPGEFTADGKARLCIQVKQSDGSSLFRIYNTKMELETTLKAPTVTYSVTTKVEKVTIPGIKLDEFDASTATWSIESEETKIMLSSLTDVEDLYNFDSNVEMRDCDLYVTQTLFNNDEEWEFAFESGTSSDTHTTVTRDNDYYATIRRYSTIAPEQKLEVYNQNGVKVCAIESKGASSKGVFIDQVWIADGKKYISIRSDGTDMYNGNYNYAVYLVNDSGLTPVSPGAKTYMRGDANGDGKIGMPDVMYDVNYILNGKFPDE